MSNIFTKIKVIATSIVFYAVLASTVISQVLDEFVSSEFSDELATVIEWGGSAVAILATAIAVIRRVTLVLPEQVGLTLPASAPRTVEMVRHPDGTTDPKPV